ncbi:peptide deformylase, partial [bacterium]|nr:peptide deformylase [bacterium]
MRELTTVPNKILRKPGRALDVSKDEYFIRELRRDLARVMRQHGALGITAHQVGEAVDFFIINQNKLKGAKKFNYFINATVTGEGEKID